MFSEQFKDLKSGISFILKRINKDILQNLCMAQYSVCKQNSSVTIIENCLN